MKRFARVVIEQRRIQRDSDDIMSIPTTPGPEAISHDKRYQRYIVNSSEINFDGEINWNLDREVTDYIKKHNFKFIYSDNSRTELFTPANQDLFDAAINASSRHGRSIYRHTYTESECSTMRDGLSKLYHINRLTNIEEIFKCLDYIFKNIRKIHLRLLVMLYSSNNSTTVKMLTILWGMPWDLKPEDLVQSNHN